MKIRKIVIRNFRGIKLLDWNVPDERIVCLIGKGDSAKTTILEGIRCIFHPQWNLSFNDSDFHLCNVNDPIDITVVFGEIPNEFLSIQKYGGLLQGWDAAKSKLNDEPEDNDEIVLSANLTVGRDLVADGDAPKDFSDKDSNDLEVNGISVMVWSEQLALEQRAMFDLPWNYVKASLKLAEESGNPVRDNVRSKLAIAQPQDLMEWQDSPELRQAIGDAAKSSAWFKSVTGGEAWVEVIADAFSDAKFVLSDLGKKLLQVRAWADHD